MQVHLVRLMVRQVGYLFLAQERSSLAAAVAALGPTRSPPLLPAPDAILRTASDTVPATSAARGDCTPIKGCAVTFYGFTNHPTFAERQPH